MASSDPAQIVWFKRDLRVSDHRVLLEASAAGPVLPLYIIEPEFWRQEDVSGRQFDFLIQSLKSLSDDLLALGSHLCVRVGDAVDILTGLARQFPGSTVWSHEETGNDRTFKRDRRVARALSQQGSLWKERGPGGVIRRLRSRDGWAGHWQRHVAAEAVPVPELQPPTRWACQWNVPVSRVVAALLSVCCRASFWSAAKHIAPPCRARWTALQPVRGFLPIWRWV